MHRQKGNVVSRTSDPNRSTHFAELIPAEWPDQPLLVHFFIPAPYPLGIPAGTILTLFGEEEVPWLQGTLHQQTEDSPLFVSPENVDGRVFVSIRTGRRTVPSHASMWEVEAAFDAASGIFGRRRTADAGGAIDSTVARGAMPRERDVTVFEAVTPLLEETVGGSADASRSLSSSFERCLDSLNEVLRAYSIRMKDWRVKPLTRQSMAPLIPWGIRHPDQQKPVGPGMFHVNPGKPQDGEAVSTLTDDEVRELNFLVSRHRQGGTRGDPIAVAAEHARRAQAACYADGDFSLSIVWSYAWVETLLDGVLLLSAWDEGVNTGEVGAWFESPLVKRVQGQFPKRFGGNWYVRQGGTAFSRWEKRVARLRHRVIHDSYRASEREAHAALEAAGNLEDYIKDRMSQRRTAYPRAALITLGVPGLKRRGAFDASVKEVARAAADDESWLASFAQYAAEVRELSRFWSE